MNPMHMIKLIGWEWIADRGRLFCVVARCGVLGLSIAGGSVMAAQQTVVSAQTNEVSAVRVLSQLNNLVQADEPDQLEDMGPSDELSATNGLPQTNGPAVSGERTNRVNRFDTSGRSQNDDRRSRGRRSYRNKSNQGGGSGSANDYGRDSSRAPASGLAGTNAPGTLDYASFKVIVDRNIFDPNRYPRRPGAPSAKPKSFDSVTLVGTMTYEKGTFAFFDGTSAEYKKALKLTDSIAGYKVTDIAPNSVKLACPTNQIELRVGAQLRREEDGPWLLAGQSMSYATLPGSGTTTGPAAASSSAGSDIIKMMMQRREKD